MVRGDQVELGQAMLDTIREQIGDDAGDLLKYDEGDLYAYDLRSGIWSPIAEHEQSCVVQTFAGAFITSAKKNLKLSAGEVAGAIKLAHHRVTEPDFFASAPAGITFKNGFVRVDRDGVTLTRHSPEHRARMTFPYEYDPCTPYPRFYQFLRELWRDDRDCEEKCVFLQDFVGACLVGQATRFQKAVMMTGQGDNGKSTLMDIVSEIFPTAARCSIPPEQWGQEYRRAMLAGKLLNYVSETSDREFPEPATFKAVVTGDSMDARHIRDSPFTFRPIAGHWFSANTLPGSSDSSNGFWRRWIVLAFNRKFEEHEKDRGLASYIVENELPGIIGWALEGAARVLARGAYVEPPSSRTALAGWRNETDSVRAYVEECCARTPLSVRWSEVTDRLHFEGAGELFADYKRWAVSSGHAPVSPKGFAQRMKANGLECIKTRLHNVYPVTLIRRGDRPADPPDDSGFTA